jgi:lysophospholipase L1-like esterase
MTRFLAFGDSITCGESGTNDGPVCVTSLSGPTAIRPLVQFPLSQTYPVVLQSELDARYSTQSPIVSNAGKSGESIASGAPTRLDGLLATGQYDALLLMEGANDIFGGGDPSTIPTAIAGLRQMVEDAKRRGILPYLATIPPENSAGCCPDRGDGESLVPAFNAQVRMLAASEGVPLVEVYQALNADINAFIGFDGLHPTAAGYAAIADVFFAAINKTSEVSPLGVMTRSRTRQVVSR